uniref:Uncharacterized protein n=1 Tax=Alexandrium andersonii TaxID=327968 RepID=A0A7S2AWN6_9DINO
MKRAREQCAVAASGASALQKENQQLRRDLQRQREELRQQQPDPDLLKDRRALQQDDGSESACVEGLEAELHLARVALVSIVPELEKRLGERDASLAEAQQRLGHLEAELEDERRSTRASGLRLLALFRPHVREGEAVWTEAESVVAAGGGAAGGLAPARQRRAATEPQATPAPQASVVAAGKEVDEGRRGPSAKEPPAMLVQAPAG